MIDDQPTKLLRVLGPLFAVSIGLGTMIGGGILRTPATVLDAVPNETLALLLWTIVGIQSLIEANVVAEVLTMFPRSGGFFVPAREAFGEPGGLLVGWADWLNYPTGIAALALLSSDFLAMIVPQIAPHKMALTVAIIMSLGTINAVGVREGEQLQILGSALKALFLLGIIVLVFALVPAAQPEPARLNAGTAGVAAFVVAYQTIFGAYNGWPNAGYFAGEDTDPGRNIPRGMFLTVISATLLYVGVSLALFHAVPIEALRHSDLPVADALRPRFGQVAVLIVACGASLIALTCCNAQVMTGPRILYSLVEERMLPRWVGRVNRGGTPIVALGLTIIASLGLAVTGTFETVFLIMAALAMVPQLLGELSLFRLRQTQPGLPRPWRALFYPWLPGLAVAVDLALLIAFLAADWKSGLYMAIAVLIVIPIGMVMRRRG